MAMLLSLTGPNQGLRVTLDRDRIVIGRHPDCDLVVPANFISRHHAQILRTNGEFFLEDLHSRNKTLLNQHEVTAPVRLHHNDQIRMGDCSYRFFEDEPVELEASLPSPLDTHFPATVPEEHLRTIRRWVEELPALVRHRPALRALADHGKVKDARAAELLWLDLPLTSEFPASAQAAATAFYLWVKALPMPEEAADRHGKAYDRMETDMHADGDADTAEHQG